MILDSKYILLDIYFVADTMQFIIAMIIMFKAHKGQVDKGGNPYIYHPLNVMLCVKGYKAKIVALLHDVVEDSNYTIEDLSKYFSSDITQAVDILTKKKKQSSKKYLKGVKENELARIVKISDINHNMKLDRLKVITDKDIERNLHYQKSLNYLVK